jgi:uncharacterized membrane protein
MSKRTNKPNRQAQGTPVRRPENGVATGGNHSAHIVTTVEHSGPLPDPATLQAYERAWPGAIEVIMKMATDEQAHRQSREVRILDRDIERDRERISITSRGQILAFILSLSAIAGGVYGMYLGHGWPGGILGSAGLASVILAFLRAPDVKPPKVPARAQHDD